jgi:hypothetical protein
MGSTRQSPDWEAVDIYVKTRLASKRDVYGWAAMDTSSEPSALILVPESVEAESFPAEVGGVRIHLKRVAPPGRY